MGRGNRVSSEKDIDLKFKLGVVQLSDGGYDNGGAYWGERIDGETLYVARSVKKTRVYGAWMDLTGDPVEDSEKIDDYVLLFADALNPAQAVRFFRRIYPNAIFV